MADGVPVCICRLAAYREFYLSFYFPVQVAYNPPEPDINIRRLNPVQDDSVIPKTFLQIGNIYHRGGTLRFNA